ITCCPVSMREKIGLVPSSVGTLTDLPSIVTVGVVTCGPVEVVVAMGAAALFVGPLPPQADAATARAAVRPATKDSRTRSERTDGVSGRSDNWCIARTSQGGGQ